MSHKRVLLLHEDQLLSNLFRDKLEDANFAVDMAHDAAAGLRLAETSTPDVMVMDSAVTGMEL